MGSLSQASLCATRTTPPRPHHRRVTRNSPEMAGLNFFENFMISGIAAGVAKTATAPIERVKLLVQNQDEMLKQGKLDVKYGGIVECTQRTFNNEGFLSFW